MSINPQTPRAVSEEPRSGAATPNWLLAVLGVLTLVLIYVAYAQQSARTALTAQLQETHKRLDALQTRTTSLEDNLASVKAQSEVTSQKLGLTQEELARARSLAQQTREEQRRTAAQLGTQVEQQQQQLGTLGGEVSTARTDIAATRQELQATQAKLERTIGDLGVQSGLIATNRQELEELKRRGERDYFEFDIRKSKEYRRVGQVSVRLNKTDTKRQKYTMTVLANDKLIEKKDKTLLEPVQFYLAGTRHLLEIVVYQVDKDHVVGYLSVPKEVAQR
jgi:archaellum component FlaC